MDTATKNDILQGLGMLKSTLLKEYSLNTRPQDYKGENAGDETLPADWQDKLKPISGGQGGFNSGDNGPDKKNTSTGSQSSDPYIHKQLSEIHAFMKQIADTQNLSMGGDSIDNNGDDDMEWDTEDVGGEEMSDDVDVELDDDNGDVELDIEKMGHEAPMMHKEDEMGVDGAQDDSDMSSIVDALNEIKGILSQMDFAKAQAAKLEKSIDDKFATMQKQMIAQSNQSKVSQAVTDILKQHGLSELPSDVPIRTSGGVTVKSSVDPVPQPLGNEMNNDNDGSFQKSEDMLEDRHNTFVGQVNSIVSRHGVNDLRGTFALVNQMRTEQVSDLSTPLYYYDNISSPK